MWDTLRKENPELFTEELLQECRELVHLAAQHEITWGKYIISEGVMGLTDKIITGFIESLADKRLKAIGLEPLYGTKNPIPWFEEAGNINNGETNFFEGKNASYVAGGSLDWED
jgi:ribonucleoside-diphosphate reductase beta chain